MACSGMDGGRAEMALDRNIKHFWGKKNSCKTRLYLVADYFFPCCRLFYTKDALMFSPHGCFSYSTQGDRNSW